MIASPRARWQPVQAGDGLRFGLVSLLIHGALAAALWQFGPWIPALRMGSATERPTTLADAQRQREARFEERAQRLEALARASGAETRTGDAVARSADPDRAVGPRAAQTPPLKPQTQPGTPDPRPAVERARQAAEALEARDAAQRIEELARQLRIPKEQAHAQVAAELARRPPVPADEAAALAQLEQRAADAAQRLQQRAERGAQGHTIDTQASQGNARGGGAGRGRSDGGQQGAGAGAGSSPGGSGSEGSSGGGSGGAGAAGAPALEGGTGFNDPRRYAAPATVPAAALAPSRIASARRIGAGGPATTRIVLDRWYVAGPFEASGPADLQRRVLPPELAVDLDAVYQGKDGRSLRWRWSDQPAYPFVPQPRVENAVYFAYTELVVDRARDVWLDLGVDDDARLWVNDVPVWTSGPEDKPWYRQPYYTMKDAIANRSLVEATRRVHLQAGRNRLLLKLYNGIDLMFFSVVVRL